MKIFTWEVVDCNTSVTIRQGSVCAKSKQEALLYIENSFTPCEKKLFNKHVLKILQTK